MNNNSWKMADKETWIRWKRMDSGVGKMERRGRGEFGGKFERLTKRVVKRVDNCYVGRARVN